MLSRHNNTFHNLDAGLERACCMSSLLIIFPAADLGIEMVKATRRIFLYGATCNKLTGTGALTGV